MPVTKENNRVLGILIRSTRMKKGYSLRELGQKANISHTLISNIETGQLIPSNETLRDLFTELDLKFYDDIELHREFMRMSKRIYTYIFNHDYSEAGVLIEELRRHEKKLMFRIDAVDYVLMKGFYYASIRVKMQKIDDAFQLYEKLIDFLTEEQKQMAFFIQGLSHLTREQYNKASDKFNQALSLGRKDRDVFIQEYSVQALVKQYKFIDAYRISSVIIKEFEDRTIYIRAMKTKLLQAGIFYHIAKNDEVYEITSFVERFARKYNVPELFEECIVFRTEIYIRNAEYEKARKQLSRLPKEQSISAYLLLFKIAYVTDDKEKIEEMYNLLSESDLIKISPRSLKYLQVQAMSKLPSLFDQNTYLKLLRWLVDFSTTYNDQEMITLSYNYLISFYHGERKYKKALDLAENLLHFKKIRIEDKL